ncbi:hypothetical protein QUA56_34935 [Microcoleus sp. N3A4]
MAESPISVTSTCSIEQVLAPSVLDRIFEAHAQIQLYERVIILILKTHAIVSVWCVATRKS